MFFSQHQEAAAVFTQCEEQNICGFALCGFWFIQFAPFGYSFLMSVKEMIHFSFVKSRNCDSLKLFKRVGPTSRSWCQTRGSRKIECSVQSACPTHWPSYHSPDNTNTHIQINRHTQAHKENTVVKSQFLHHSSMKTKHKEVNYRVSPEEDHMNLKPIHRIFLSLSLSLSPQRQKCFQSQMGRGPGTGHQLCDRGNSAAAARSPHPTMHMCHRHWRSGASRHKRTEIHEYKSKAVHLLYIYNTFYHSCLFV